MPLVVPGDEPGEARPLTRTGRRVRAVDASAHVSPLGALAGAAMAVGGVVLAIVALLSVTDQPSGSPVLAEEPAAVVATAEPQQTAEVPAPTTPAAAPTTPVPATALPATAAPATAAPATAAPVAPRPASAAAPRRAATGPRPPVTVLNNSRVTGLADRAAARLVRAGWPVRQVGNFRGQLRATTLYYEPGQRAAAQRFAATFGGVQRVLPRAANIPGPRGLVVVLTRDYA